MIYNKVILDIQEWALSVYFSNIVDFLQKNSKDIFESQYVGKQIIAECKKYIKQKKSPNEFFYLKSNKCDRHYEISAVFVFGELEDKQASWNDDVIHTQTESENENIFRLGLLCLYFDLFVLDNLDEINKKVFQIKTVIHHEVMHIFQTFIKCESGSIYNEKTQISSKIRNSKHNDDLPDCEFITFVIESICFFQNKIKTVPQRLHKRFFNYWVANSNEPFSFDEKEKEFPETFKNWSYFHPEKYKKATKILYKEIENLL